MKSSHRLALHVRPDYETKSGGDVFLARSFMRRALDCGLKATLVSSQKDLIDFSPTIFVGFNLDQPTTLLRMLNAAKTNGCKTFIYGLHHPYEGVSAYLRSGVRGVRRSLGILTGFDPKRYFVATSFARALSSFDMQGLLYAARLNQTKLAAQIAMRCDCLLVSGHSELGSIVATMPMFSTIPSRVVPHPIDLQADLLSSIWSSIEERSTGAPEIVIAGRIESRKNQLRVLEVAEAFPELRFVFIGAANTTDREYVRKFERELHSQQNCVWLGPLPLADLLRRIATARAVISPSWFEVMSLVALYAYAFGVPVASSMHTYDGDVMGDSVYRFDPASGTSLSNALRKLLCSSPVRKFPIVQSAKDLAASRSDALWLGFDQLLRDASDNSL